MALFLSALTYAMALVSREDQKHCLEIDRALTHQKDAGLLSIAKEFLLSVIVNIAYIIVEDIFKGKIS